MITKGMRLWLALLTLVLLAILLIWQFGFREGIGRPAAARTEVRFWFEPFKPRFEQIRAAFLAIPKTPEITNIEKLYALDEQLEKLVLEAGGKYSSYFPTIKGVVFEYFLQTVLLGYTFNRNSAINPQ
ncbi:hypothetical protein [Sideroxydans lithotrophicus]|uniref:Uncharacterized protein n=1 Tax=Sideroxydans lithotrophicus (strain ES-1) TaxID=580332 RepID=D5CR61_SIDLE|nr:hypothetical protein [Sideroxydans lithotrophicus]ADE11447.1 hypothetical protein Slit_1209 [Sideroxydans lithotrophicus ES-1]